MNDRNEIRKKISITIDGVRYTTRDDDQEAAALLRLAGVNPAEFDLGRITKSGQTKSYRDTKIVELKDGDAFVTVRQSAPVA